MSSVLYVFKISFYNKTIAFLVPVYLPPLSLKVKFMVKFDEII